MSDIKVKIARAIASASVVELLQEHGRDTDETTIREYVYELGLNEQLEAEVIKFMKAYAKTAYISVHVDTYAVKDDGTIDNEQREIMDMPAF